MAYSNIDKPNQYFDTATYAGSESSQDITSLNFQPDWVWIKNRTTTPSHQLTDVVRGVHNVIYSNLTNAENQSSSLNSRSFHKSIWKQKRYVTVFDNYPEKKFRAVALKL